MHQRQPKPKKDERLVVRCTVDTLVEFKQVAAEFKNREDAIKSFIEVFKQKPYLFPGRRRKIGPQFK